MCDVATIEILCFSTALCTIINSISHNTRRHRVKQTMYVRNVNFGNGEVFRYTNHSNAVFFFFFSKGIFYSFVCTPLMWHSQNLLHRELMICYIVEATYRIPFLITLLC